MVRAEIFSTPPLSALLEETAARVARSTVRILAGGGAAGSGAAVSDDGRVITNAHVAFRRAVRVELPDGATVEGAVLAREQARDLALVEIGRRLSGLPLGDSDRLRAGEMVFSLGNPLGGAQALSLGVVNSAPTSRDGRRSMIQADLRLAPGYSGGPMVNAHGEIIGINTMVSGGLGLVIPSNDVARFLRRATGPRLGILLQPVQGVFEAAAFRTLHDGLLVAEVQPDGLAARAGIIPGDIVIGAQGCPLASIEQLSDVMSRGGAIRLDLLRGGRVHSMEVNLGVEPEREAERAA